MPKVGITDIQTTRSTRNAVNPVAPSASAVAASQTYHHGIGYIGRSPMMSPSSRYPTYTDRKFAPSGGLHKPVNAASHNQLNRNSWSNIMDGEKTNVCKHHGRLACAWLCSLAARPFPVPPALHHNVFG